MNSLIARSFIVLLAGMISLCSTSTPAEVVFREVNSARSTADVVIVEFDGQAFETLHGGTRALLAALPIPGGKQLDFEVAPRFASPIDGATVIQAMTPAGPRALPAPKLQALAGQDPGGSGAELSLSCVNGAVYGFVDLGDGIVYSIMPSGSGRAGEHQIAALPDDIQTRPFCGVDKPGSPLYISDEVEESEDALAAVYARDKADALTRAVTPPDHEVTVAVEVNHELFASMGEDADAIAAYVAALFSDASYIYQRDHASIFRIVSLRIWTSEAEDPYPVGDESRDYLYALGDVMANPGTPEVIRTADIGHILVGKPNLGGVAYVGILCNGDNSVRAGMSGLYGTASLPIATYVWDLQVLVHEIGHNFASRHTHCYTPPIDNCYNGQEGCYSGPVSGTVGTIMSYCHLGFRTEMRFHSRVRALIADSLAGRICLDDPTGDPYEPDNSAGEAKVVTLHHDQFRAIKPGEEDWAFFTLTKPSQVVIETVGDVGDTALTLFDGTMQQIVSDDNSGAGNFSRIFRECGEEQLPAGTYYIRVTAGAATPAYALRFADYACDGSLADTYEPDSTPELATPLVSGIGQTHTINPHGETDWFTFDIVEISIVALGLNVTSGSSVNATLYDSEFNVLDYRTSVTGTSIAKECGPDALLPGTYYVHVSASPSGTSRYNLTLYIAQRCCVVNPEEFNYGMDISGGMIDIGIEAEEGCEWEAAADVDWLTFPGGNTGSGSATLTVQVDSSTVPNRAGVAYIGVGAARTVVVNVSQFEDCNGNQIPDGFELGANPNAIAADDCSQAETIMPGVVYTGSTASASPTPSIVDLCGASDESNDVWYRYSPATAGTLSVSTCNSGYDTVLAVFNACPDDSLQPLACNDDFCGVQSQVELEVTPGNTYLIRVSGWNGNTGTFQLLLTGPDAVAATAADVNGNGIIDECEIEIDKSSIWTVNGDILVPP